MADKIAPSTSLPPEKKLLLDKTLSEFRKVTDELAIAQARQKELRTFIGTEFFPGAGKGTTTMPLEYGKALKFVQTTTLSVNAEQLEAVRTAAISAQDGELVTAIDEIFTYKPQVSASGWGDLSPALRLKLADVVTEKLGLPSVEIATPKR